MDNIGVDVRLDSLRTGMPEYPADYNGLRTRPQKPRGQTVTEYSDTAVPLSRAKTELVEHTAYDGADAFV